MTESNELVPFDSGYGAQTRGTHIAPDQLNADGAPVHEALRRIRIRLSAAACLQRLEAQRPQEPRRERHGTGGHPAHPDRGRHGRQRPVFPAHELAPRAGHLASMALPVVAAHLALVVMTTRYCWPRRLVVGARRRQRTQWYSVDVLG